MGASTTSPLLLSLAETSLRSTAQCVASQTQRQSWKRGLDLTTSLTLCMLRGLLCIGLLGRVWRRESLVKQGRILLLWSLITRRLAQTTTVMKRTMITKFESEFTYICFTFLKNIHFLLKQI